MNTAPVSLLFVIKTLRTNTLLGYSLLVCGKITVLACIIALTTIRQALIDKMSYCEKGNCFVIAKHILCSPRESEMVLAPVIHFE